MDSDRGVKRKPSISNISPPPLKRKVESTTTNKAIANFFTPLSQKKPNQITWRIVNHSLVVGKYSWEEPNGERNAGHVVKRRIAAFDLDNTLIETVSGNRFPKDGGDWKWLHPQVPGRIKNLNTQGYHVIAISNQKKISLKKKLKEGKIESKSLVTFKQKVTSIMKDLDIPFSIYAATETDEYRKPRIGLWREILDDYDLDVTGALDLDGSFFVGDAAGRPGDHSCSDRDFAENVGIPFKTPEEYFLDEPPKPIQRDFDPKAYINDQAKDEVPFSGRNDLDLVIFCGSPSAGKSTFYWKYLQPLGYERVNQDILKTRPKCIQVANDFLRARKSVVVDNTNADPETRAFWVTLAKDASVPIRCIYFSTPAKICRHNNAVRAANSNIETINPESRPLLPDIAFIDFARRFHEPSLAEGFQDITRVDFRFHGTPATAKIWGQYWV